MPSESLPKGLCLGTSRTLSCLPRRVRSRLPVTGDVTHSVSEGERPLPTMLGGGDLDGDIYAVMQYKPLLSVINWTAAE